MATIRPAWNFDDEFEGGEETCGRVIVNLYLYIRSQQPGYRILVISRDPREMADDIVRILREELIDLRDAGYDFVQFDEPVLTEVVLSEECGRRTFM